MRLQSLCTVTNAKRSLAGLLLGLALVSDGGAFAQDTATTPVTAEGELGVRTQAKLSGADQITEADAILRRGNRLAERLSRMLDESRRDKDILRANCVNRKLTETNANVRNVEQRVRALKEAVQTGDNTRRDHEYTVLSVLSQKLDSLSQEASQCLGEALFEPGASQVITTVPTNIFAGTDPSTVVPPPPPPPAVNVPPPMSGIE